MIKKSRFIHKFQFFFLFINFYFVANATSALYQTIHERKVQLMMAEKILNEHRDVLIALRESQVISICYLHKSFCMVVNK